jgi:general secretion pathway protein D
VVRDTSATDSLSFDRYDLMRATQELAQPLPSVAVPVNEAPVLPAPLVRPPGTAPAIQKQSN